MTEIFRRVEKKYILNRNQYENLKKEILNYMKEDQYGKSKICNIYFDTDNYSMIQHSIQKPFFKEKVRLRSYNIPSDESKVYLEIKRKYDGVVGKRRIGMMLSDFNEYMKNPSLVENKNKQIKTELDYYFKLYSLKKAMYISYEREAYYQNNNSDFRLTFDTKILARNYDLDLSKGSYGVDILGKDKYIMEVKTLGAIPFWFVNLLEKYNVIPGSFSKYGTAYEMLILKPNMNCLKELVFEAQKTKDREYQYAV